MRVPIISYVLNSLTGDIWLSVINNHLLMFRLPAFVATLLYKLAPPLTSWGAVLSGILETPSPGLDVLKIPTE